MPFAAEALARKRDVTPLERPLVFFGGMPVVGFSPGTGEDERATPECAWDSVDWIRSLSLSSGLADVLEQVAEVFRQRADVLRQVADLLRGDEMDEYGLVRPSPFALGKGLDVFLGTSIPTFEYIARHDTEYRFPRGCVTTDEQGGLRVEWSDEDRAVHLVVSGVPDGRSYIYHELGEKYGTEDRLTGSVLAHWLQRVFG